MHLLQLYLVTTQALVVQSNRNSSPSMGYTTLENTLTWPIGNGSHVHDVHGQHLFPSSMCMCSGSKILMNGHTFYIVSQERCRRGQALRRFFCQKARCSAILVKYCGRLRLFFVLLFIFLPLLSIFRSKIIYAYQKRDWSLQKLKLHEVFVLEKSFL